MHLQKCSHAIAAGGQIMAALKVNPCLVLLHVECAKSQTRVQIWYPDIVLHVQVSSHCMLHATCARSQIMAGCMFNPSRMHAETSCYKYSQLLNVESIVAS